MRKFSLFMLHFHFSYHDLSCIFSFLRILITLASLKFFLKLNFNLKIEKFHIHKNNCTNQNNHHKNRISSTSFRTRTSQKNKSKTTTKHWNLSNTLKKSIPIISKIHTAHIKHSKNRSIPKLQQFENRRPSHELARTCSAQKGHCRRQKTLVIFNASQWHVLLLNDCNPLCATPFRARL